MIEGVISIQQVEESTQRSGVWGMTIDEILAVIEDSDREDLAITPITFRDIRRLARIVRAADELADAVNDVDHLLRLHNAWENYRKVRDGDVWI